MAKTTITHVTDDIDGTEDAQEVAFSFDGVDYTIDLAKKNRVALEKAMKPYLAAATRVSRSGGARRSKKTGSAVDLAAVREWARQNGIEVSDRGRVSRAVLEQYEAAR